MRIRKAIQDREPVVYDIQVADSFSSQLYRLIPSMNRLLREPGFDDLAERYSRPLLLEVANEVLDEIREEISAGRMTSSQLEDRMRGLRNEIEGRLEQELAPSLRPVINATGVIVFTNAGRAPIAEKALSGLEAVGGRYTNLEYDLAGGGRGHRDLHFERIVTRLTRCEAATVCNNAAAALLLILNTLALGKKVLVSRGELIEIGGSFRLPAVMEKSGALLSEVGTTNRTRAEDYRNAADGDTALILRVHPSNYQIVGFTERPALGELVEVARDAHIPLVHDVGSGCLIRTQHRWLSQEPVVEESLAAGSDLVCFSGDKLLGGPQAGLILGRRELIRRIRKNPLMRALRLDKLIYSTLERTLIEYRAGRAHRTVPVWRFLQFRPEELEERASSIRGAVCSVSLHLEIIDGYSLVGGGSAPEERIPSRLLALHSSVLSANVIEERLRRFRVPVLTRIEDDRVLIDLRTVFPEQDDLIIEALGELEAGSRELEAGS